MIIILFSVIFIGVGTTSLAYGQSFAEVLGDYCIQKCAETRLLEQDDPVGCDCRPEPGNTTLPTVVFVVSTPLHAACRLRARLERTALQSAFERSRRRLVWW